MTSTGSRTEAWAIWHHRGYNVEKGLFFAPEGTVVDMQDLTRVCDSIEDKIQNIGVIQRLDLTYEETVLLGCIAIMSPGT